MKFEREQVGAARLLAVVLVQIVAYPVGDSSADYVEEPFVATAEDSAFVVLVSAAAAAVVVRRVVSIALSRSGRLTQQLDVGEVEIESSQSALESKEAHHSCCVHWAFGPGRP